MRIDAMCEGCDDGESLRREPGEDRWVHHPSGIPCDRALPHSGPDAHPDLMRHGDLGPAPDVPAAGPPEAPCRTEPFSSRACELGARSCVVRHRCATCPGRPIDGTRWCPAHTSPEGCSRDAHCRCERCWVSVLDDL